MMSQSKYILPDGMTPEELRRIAQVMSEDGEITKKPHIVSIMQLNNWADLIARAEEKP